MLEVGVLSKWLGRCPFKPKGFYLAQQLVDTAGKVAASLYFSCLVFSFSQIGYHGSRINIGK